MYKKSEKLRLIRKELENAQCLGVAIEKAGLKSSYTVYLWRKRPMIERYIQKCMATSDSRRVDAVVDTLFKTALSGNVAAMCFFLKNKAGWRDVTEHSGNFTNVHYVYDENKYLVPHKNRILDNVSVSSN